MKNIALITNFNIYDKANAAMTVAEELLKYDARVLIATVNIGHPFSWLAVIVKVQDPRNIR